MKDENGVVARRAVPVRSGGAGVPACADGLEARPTVVSKPAFSFLMVRRKRMGD